MKKLVPIILSAFVLAGCSGNSGGGEISDSVTSETTVTTTVTETEKISETTTATTAETTSVTTTVVMEEKAPINAELCVNADGTLNEFFTEKIIKLAEQNKPDYGLVYPALWDFDGDGVPEIILTNHNSGQGLMPSYVYSAESLEQIGEFDGFCRDGFTRFIKLCKRVRHILYILTVFRSFCRNFSRCLCSNCCRCCFFGSNACGTRFARLVCLRDLRTRISSTAR